ncbi:hypothetical protein F2Q70_00016504 [Brassica cretica]|uniref:Uncharacterized protein n=1 Tax=Brassica cretica TaxID=69181 RepID=A0A8S9I310_BRACR|nr:hypothetical protein F2Q70_00016504 [Brassica cretica]
MTHSFLERIGQPEVDLANHREESAPFNVHDATSILEFSSSQMFSMLFRSKLDMRGDRFSTFGEFRSVCKIWMNNYGTIYRDRKNRLRLSSLDYPPSRKYLSSLEDAVLSLLSFACSFPFPLLVYDVDFCKKVQSNRIVKAAKVAIASEDVISVAIASGREPRRVPLVFVVAIASEDVISVAIASGREPRRVQLVFVVRSQQKFRLRRNEKRSDEDSKENQKEDLSEALQVAIASEDVISVAIASGREPRRVQLVFVVRSQRKLRLRRNKKRSDEDSKENPKEDLSEALPVAT